MHQTTTYLNDLGALFFDLRKKKGLTQEQVAESIGIQRSAYVLIEAGKRNVSTPELFKLSAVLQFSIPEVLGKIFGSEIKPTVDDVIYERRRMFNFLKFKNVLLYILDRCKGKDNVGKVVLNKLLYFSDFGFYEKYQDYLTGLRYSKLPKGPVPGIEPYIEQMKANMELREIPVEYYGYPSIRWIPLVKPDMNVFTESELEVMDEVIAKYADMSARDISDLSHEDPPWLETPSIGDEIDYNLVFKRNQTENDR